ncbi:MAG: hybrid sensor histidine kinase/response regulator [Bdellovibrionaceae bacterium]|jgi:two-component system, sensor histidine kinase and response regulator|nr:hybrid sensor histidine kinase/response regulator [Pseudobdellovibrionaceae bacterium]
MKHTLLCVDDEKDILSALERVFRKKYNVITANSAKEGLELLRNNEVSIIISDQKMPQMTGVEFLKASIKVNPKPIRILLTGYTDIDSVIKAINTGEIYRYITKPWDPVDFINTVGNAIEKYELRKELVEKNIALSDALEELKSLDEAKNNFMFLVNHELKTPLTVITSFMELLKETSLDEEQELYTQRISKSVQKLNHLIHEVLELVSAETGQVQLNFQKISSKVLFEDIDIKYIKPAKYKNVQVTQDIDDIKLLIDKKIILNIIDRIMDNALKFCNKDSIIQLSVKLVDQENYKAKVSITNEGEAISKTVIQKILKPFTLNEETMNHSKGFGLGLSISQALLGTQNSSLEFKSQDEHTEVSFLLDVVK